MRKIQITIAVYVLIVLIVSIFFMPMNKNAVIGNNVIEVGVVDYKPVWDTKIEKLDDQYQFHSIDISAYKLYLLILTTIALSIIAIQSLEILKQKQIADTFKQLNLFDND